MSAVPPTDRFRLYERSLSGAGPDRKIADFPDPVAAFAELNRLMAAYPEDVLRPFAHPPGSRQRQDGIVMTEFFIVSVEDGTAYPFAGDPDALVRVGPTDHLVINFARPLTMQEADEVESHLPPSLRDRVVLVSAAGFAVVEPEVQS